MNVWIVRTTHGVIHGLYATVDASVAFFTGKGYSALLTMDHPDFFKLIIKDKDGSGPEHVYHGERNEVHK